MKIFDPKLTGSIAFENAVQGNIEITGDLVVPGSITAREFKTEFVSASIIYQSGSTQFGNSADDTHVFTGRITQNDGNLGIGTVATTAHIHEASTGVANLRLTELGAGGSAQIYLENPTETFELGADASPQGFYIRALNDPNGYGQATFFLNASGSLGLGITTPQSRLHIANTGGADNIPLIGFGEAGTNEFGFKGHFAGTGETGNSFEFYSEWTDNILRFLGNGNVGIGTPSPGAKLDVNVGLNSLKISGRDTYIDSTEDSLNANIYVTQDGAGDFNQEAGHLVIQSRTQGTVYRDIIFAGGLSSGGSLMTITGQGDVGIGTASPQQKLHIHNSSGNFSAEATIRGALSAGAPKAEIAFKRGTSGDGAGLVLRASNSSGTLSDSIVIKDGDGNVGIGSTSPQGRLHVAKTSVSTKYVDSFSTAVIEDTEARLQLVGDDGGSNASAITLSNGANHWTIHHRGPGVGNYLGIGYANTTDNTDIVNSAMSNIVPLVIKTDGNVGIGNTDPLTTFHVGTAGGRALFGSTYTQPAGSPWTLANSQVIIGGPHNSGANNDNPGVKLLITGHNNDSANIYPIYVEDENGLLDFYLKGRTSGAGRPHGVFAGDLSVGTTTNRATLDVEGSIQQTSRSRIITFTKAIGDNVGTDIAGFTGGDPSGATILVTIVVNASSGYAVKTLRYLWNIRRATAGTSRNVVELTGADLGSVNSGVVSVGSTTAVALFNSYERFRFSVDFSGVAVSTLYVKMEALGDNVSGLNPI